MIDTGNAARVSRRALLMGLGAGALGSATVAAPAVAAFIPARRNAGAGDLARGHIGDWAAHVGERFSLAGGGALRLVAVEPLCSGGRSPSRSQCFAAVFEAVGGAAPAGDATYFLASGSAAALPLHFGAAAQVDGRTRLVAVFN